MGSTHLLFHNQGKGAPIGLPDWKRDTWVVPTDIPLVEANALRWLYDNTAGDNWTTNTNWGLTTTANDWYGITVVGGNVTVIDIDTNNLVGNIGAFAIDAFTVLLTLQMHANAGLIGDISGWTPPITVKTLYLFTTGLSGDVMAGWTLWADLDYLRLDNTSISGDMAGWVIPAGVIHLYVNSTNASGVPDLSSATSIDLFRYGFCSLPEADVDGVLLAIATRFSAGGFTAATPEIRIGGTNAAPSGAYADEDPPSTGLGAVFEICTDPETTGYNTWVVLVAGSGPYP